MLSGRPPRKDRFGRFLFFIPVVIILAVVAFALWSTLAQTNGLLVVRAQESDTASTPLHATAAVDGMTLTTPFNLSLSKGSYEVNFQTLAWYTPPPPRTVALQAGGTAYAVGVYTPIVRRIAISGTAFNETSTTALHGVTPVVWINEGPPLVLDIQGLNPVSLQTGQNYTHIFQAGGTFTFSVYDSSSEGEVLVI